MAKQNDSLKDRLSRSREIQHQRDRQKVRTHHLNPGLVRIGRTTSFTCCRCRGRIRSGTRTCSRIHRFTSRQEVQRLSSRLFLSLTPNRCRPWSRNSARSTGPSDVKKYYSKFDVAVRPRCNERSYDCKRGILKGVKTNGKVVPLRRPADGAVPSEPDLA